jgi:hypothetical protein
MAIVRTGPTPAHRRDIGPAAGSSGDGLAAIGRLSAFDASGGARPVDDGSMAAGSGPVERRRETVSERKDRETREAAVRTTPTRPPGLALQLVRVAPAAVAAKPLEEPIVPNPAPTPLETVVAPCGTCLHEAVCALKASIPKPSTQLQPIHITDGVRLFPMAWRVECDHYLGEQPVTIRREHGGESWRTPSTPEQLQASRKRGGEANRERIRKASIDELKPRHASKAGEDLEKAQRAARVVAALERHGGDRRTAAAELGMKLNAFSMVLKYAERRTPPAATA